MMENLKMAMKVRTISAATIAKVIGTTEKTVNNKLNGISEFTVSEAKEISQSLFPEYDFFYLFKPMTQKDGESA